MLPTLTIPSVAPARTSEPAGNPAAADEGGGAFADALQRAQVEPKPADSKEPRAQASKPADAHAHATRRAQAPGQAPERGRQPAGDAACDDAAASIAVGEPAAGDATPHSHGLPEDASTEPLPPVMAIEVPVTAQAVVETNRGERPRAADAADSEPIVDDRAAPSRPASRLGGAHDLRATPSMPGRATLPNEAASARDNSAAAGPLHAVIEHTAADAAAAPAAALHSPSFERQATEPSATLLAAAPIARDMAAAAPGADAKAPQATLHAAIDEPAFGAALGTQVSLWVRDGVQEARLQLHPAELGPVTVQIALDGQAAHVDFTAAVAATRESIEQSLPALAAALRESGFTLIGGGVSSHAGQAGAGDGRRERAQAGPGNRSRGDAGDEAGHAASAPRRWTRSLLDVYA